MIKALSITAVALGLFTACQNQPAAGDLAVKTITPVTTIYPENITLNDDVTLNATSVYLLKTFVKASTNGYIQTSNITLGQTISKGNLLFTLKTKEAQSLGNTINKLDASFNFSGLNQIKSPINGLITSLNHQKGDYVQDGEALAEMADLSSFGFLMNVPYEYHQLLNSNKAVNIELPDGRILPGYIAKIMPTLDSVSQTQKVLVKLQNNIQVPENLIAHIKLQKGKSSQYSLPKQSILSDENQQHFWVMKMINDSTAVKLDIKKGIEANDRIEITSPQFTGKERILLSGNYGLADTAMVRIER